MAPFLPFTHPNYTLYHVSLLFAQFCATYFGRIQNRFRPKGQIISKYFFFLPSDVPKILYIFLNICPCLLKCLNQKRTKRSFLFCCNHFLEKRAEICKIIGCCFGVSGDKKKHLLD